MKSNLLILTIYFLISTMSASSKLSHQLSVPKVVKNQHDFQQTSRRKTKSTYFFLPNYICDDKKKLKPFKVNDFHAHFMNTTLLKSLVKQARHKRSAFTFYYFLSPIDKSQLSPITKPALSHQFEYVWGDWPSIPTWSKLPITQTPSLRTVNWKIFRSLFPPTHTINHVIKTMPTTMTMPITGLTTNYRKKQSKIVTNTLKPTRTRKIKTKAQLGSSSNRDISTLLDRPLKTHSDAKDRPVDQKWSTVITGSLMKFKTYRRHNEESNDIRSLKPPGDRKSEVLGSSSKTNAPYRGEQRNKDGSLSGLTPERQKLIGNKLATNRSKNIGDYNKQSYTLGPAVRFLKDKISVSNYDYESYIKLTGVLKDKQSRYNMLGVSSRLTKKPETEFLSGKDKKIYLFKLDAQPYLPPQFDKYSSRPTYVFRNTVSRGQVSITTDASNLNADGLEIDDNDLMTKRGTEDNGPPPTFVFRNRGRPWKQKGITKNELELEENENEHMVDKSELGKKYYDSVTEGELKENYDCTDEREGEFKKDEEEEINADRPMKDNAGLVNEDGPEQDDDGSINAGGPEEDNDGSMNEGPPQEDDNGSLNKVGREEDDEGSINEGGPTKDYDVSINEGGPEDDNDGSVNEGGPEKADIGSVNEDGPQENIDVSVNEGGPEENSDDSVNEGKPKEDDDVSINEGRPEEDSDGSVNEGGPEKVDVGSINEDVPVEDDDESLNESLLEQDYDISRYVTDFSSYKLIHKDQVKAEACEKEKGKGLEKIKNGCAHGGKNVSNSSNADIFNNDWGEEQNWAIRNIKNKTAGERYSVTGRELKTSSNSITRTDAPVTFDWNESGSSTIVLSEYENTLPEREIGSWDNEFINIVPNKEKYGDFSLIGKGGYRFGGNIVGAEVEEVTDDKSDSDKVGISSSDSEGRVHSGQSGLRKGGSSSTSKCYTCGLDIEGIPIMSECYEAFDARDFRNVYKRPRFETECSSDTIGCFKRFLDIDGTYYEKGCRKWPPTEGKSFASIRFAKLEIMLKDANNSCVFSPNAVLTPFSRGISLWVRYHVCVCNGNFCNTQSKIYLPPGFVLLISSFLLIYNSFGCNTRLLVYSESKFHSKHWK